MSRAAAVTVACVLPAIATVAAAAALADDPPPTVTETVTTTSTVTTTRTRTVTVPGRYRGRTAWAWANQARARTRDLQTAQQRAARLRRVLLHRPSSVEAINLACATYGYCSTLWRKAACETGGTFSARARNPSGASGLFQFLPSTWATTPFGRFSIWSPYANALAAGWMHAQGRGGEWECR